MVGVSGRFHRRTKAVGHTEQNIFSCHMLGDAVTRAKSVLDCQNQCIRADDRGDGACGCSNLAGFSGDDTQITGANVCRINCGVNSVNYSVSTGAFDA